MNVAVLETWAWRSWSTNSCSRSAFIHEMQDHRPNRRVVWKRIKQADTQKQSWIQWEDASFSCERPAFRPNLLFGTTSMHIVKTLRTNYIDNLQNRFLLLLFIVVCVFSECMCSIFFLRCTWSGVNTHSLLHCRDCITAINCHSTLRQNKRTQIYGMNLRCIWKCTPTPTMQQIALSLSHKQKKSVIVTISLCVLTWALHNPSILLLYSGNNFSNKCEWDRSRATVTAQFSTEAERQSRLQINVAYIEPNCTQKCTKTHTHTHIYIYTRIRTPYNSKRTYTPCCNSSFEIQFIWIQIHMHRLSWISYVLRCTLYVYCYVYLFSLSFASMLICNSLPMTLQQNIRCRIIYIFIYIYNTHKHCPTTPFIYFFFLAATARHFRGNCFSFFFCRAWSISQSDEMKMNSNVKV